MPDETEEHTQDQEEQPGSPERAAKFEVLPPARPSPEGALGIRPSRFAFVNRINRDRIEAYTGVIRSATSLVVAQTDLEKAKAKLLDVGQEIERDRRRGDLEDLTLDVQIEETKQRLQELEKEKRLAALEEQRDRAKLEHEIKSFTPQEAEAGQRKERTPQERRQQVLRDIENLDQEMQRVLVQIAQGKNYENLQPEEQERFDRVRNTYDNLIAKKLDEMERQ